jgi:hypothetical protein
MCKISDWNSVSKFVFEVTCPVKTQYVYGTPLYQSGDLFHAHRVLLFGRFSWNFSIILHLVISTDVQNFRLRFHLEVCLRGYMSCENIVCIWYTPIPKLRLISRASRASIWSILLKFQYNSTFGDLNWCAKFQTDIRSRSLSQGYTSCENTVCLRYTPIPKLRLISRSSRASIWSILLKFQYNSTFGDLNWCAKFHTEIPSRSLSSRLDVLFRTLLTSRPLRRRAFNSLDPQTSMFCLYFFR